MISIKTFLTAAFISGLSMVSYGQQMNLSDFDRIEVSGNIVTTLINSNKNSIEIEMISGDIDNLKSEVEGNSLILKIKNNKGWNNQTKAKITVYHDGISNLDASAGAKAISEDVLHSVHMDVSVSSGANCDINLESEKLNVDVSSGARARIKGSSMSQRADVSSGASYDGLALKTSKTDVEASSGASAKVWSTEEIKAEANSGGSVKYKGDPKNASIDTDKYSGGSVKKI